MVQLSSKFAVSVQGLLGYVGYTLVRFLEVLGVAQLAGVWRGLDWGSGEIGAGCCHNTHAFQLEGIPPSMVRTSLGREARALRVFQGTPVLCPHGAAY